MRAAGGTAVTVPMDVRDRADHTALVDRARAEFGRLDVLVANAGVGRVRPLDELPVEEWDEMIDVNLRGVLYGLAAALPVFRAQEAGHLVVVASTSGLRVVPGQVVYAATKNAVRTLCEGLRADYRAQRDEIALDPAAIARAVVFALEQPAGVDVNQLVVRPTAQG